MVFVKTVKNKAYYKRFQVKYRRRREGKTDYAARTVLVKQEKSKYNSPKHRFVVRLTNKRVICQIIYSTIMGDKVVCAADSLELKRYGIPVGLKNYSAAYATGLLLARRVLKKLGMDDMYKGVEVADGEEFYVEENAADERRPFKALLDVGLVITTTGNRVFGALKGAVDGGLNVPHSIKRFPGYSKEEGASEGSYDPETHKNRIFGDHVSTYMQELKEESPESFERQFSQYIKNKISPDGMEKMYADAHKKIRANPDRPAKAARKHAPVKQRVGNNIKTSKGEYPRPLRLTNVQRKERVAAKIAKAVEAAQADA